MDWFSLLWSFISFLYALHFICTEWFHQLNAFNSMLQYYTRGREREWKKWKNYTKRGSSNTKTYCSLFFLHSFQFARPHTLPLTFSLQFSIKMSSIWFAFSFLISFVFTFFSLSPIKCHLAIVRLLPFSFLHLELKDPPKKNMKSQTRAIKAKKKFEMFMSSLMAVAGATMAASAYYLHSMFFMLSVIHCVCVRVHL